MFVPVCRSRFLSRPSARQAGFSLPELMVVLAIIMLLFTIALPRVRRAKEKAEEGAAVATMQAVHTSEEAHRITTGAYASNFKVLVGERGAPIVADNPDTEEDESAGQTVMVHSGYIFRLDRPNPEEYTVTAEPVERRAFRPYYRMDHLGNITATVGGGQGGGGVGPTQQPVDTNPVPPPTN